MTEQAQRVSENVLLDSDDNSVESLASRFYVPDSVFLIVLVILATVVPQAYGLSFARNGLTIDGVRISAAIFFSTLNFSPYQFFLIGFIPSAIFLFTLVLAIFYIKLKFLRYLTILTLIPTQFIVGFAYTRLNFTNPTHAVYHNEAYKINAINVGVITVLLIACLLLLLIIIALILRKKFNRITHIYKKSTCLIIILLLTQIFQVLVVFSPVLQWFRADGVY